MQDQANFTRARRGAGANLGFYIHLTVYVLVNALLISINLGTSTKHLWFKWPLLGWGVGILAHAIATFALPRRMRTRRRRIEELLRKRASESP
jgi:uncharacterized membrane protein